MARSSARRTYPIFSLVSLCTCLFYMLSSLELDALGIRSAYCCEIEQLFDSKPWEQTSASCSVVFVLLLVLDSDHHGPVQSATDCFPRRRSHAFLCVPLASRCSSWPWDRLGRPDRTACELLRADIHHTNVLPLRASTYRSCLSGG